MGPLVTAAATYLWDKIPGWFKWILAAVVILFYTPIKIREELIYFIDTRVHAVIIPMKEKRDQELKDIHSDLGDMKQDIRDVKNYLLYKKRPEENEGTQSK